MEPSTSSSSSRVSRAPAEWCRAAARPVAGVIVSYSPQDALDSDARTGDDRRPGTLRSRRPQRRPLLRARSPAKACATSGQAIVASTSTVDIELPPGGTAGHRDVERRRAGRRRRRCSQSADASADPPTFDKRSAIRRAAISCSISIAGSYRVRATKIGFEERLASASVSDSMVQLDLAMVGKPALRLRFTDAVDRCADVAGQPDCARCRRRTRVSNRARSRCRTVKDRFRRSVLESTS